MNWQPNVEGKKDEREIMMQYDWTTTLVKSLCEYNFVNYLWM